jgi:thiamine biosynthesis lipoprotein
MRLYTSAFRGIHNRFKMTKVHKFSDRAMATRFECIFVNGSAEFAASLAGHCFRELDRVEALLSRFVEGSDVFRINHLNAGEAISVSSETVECVQLAFELNAYTGGAFDPAVGGYLDLLRKDPTICEEDDRWKQAVQKRETGKLILDPDTCIVECELPGLQLDLGGIGKGYALDKLRVMLEEFELYDFLLSAGGSTLAARGQDENDQPWYTHLVGDSMKERVHLLERSISGSGTAIQGNHIVNSGKIVDAYEHKRVWVLADSGAVADAFSTAFMLCDLDKIRVIAEKFPPQLEVWVEADDGSLKKL